MGLRPHLSLCACKTARLAPELLVSMGHCPHLWFLHAKQGLLDQNYKSLLVSAFISGFCMQNRRDLHQIDKSIWVPAIISDFESLCFPALICGFWQQNSDFWTSIQVSMGTRSHLSFCAWKTAWLAQELLVSMGSSPHLWFCAFKTATLGPKLHVSVVPRPHLWISACKTACLASELLVSMGPSPHLWFLHAKQRLLDTNNKSPLVPESICLFVHAIHRD